jgi:hypothetical protein
MIELLPSFEQLATEDHSFRVDAPWRGGFEMAGQRVTCEFDGPGWLSMSVPVDGDAASLLARQRSLRVPVKVLHGPILAGELPCADDLFLAFRTLRGSLSQALAILGGSTSPDDEEQDGTAQTGLDAVLQASALDWAINGDKPTTKAGGLTIAAERRVASVTFSTRLVKLAASAPCCLQALTDVLLALNRRLRFARGTLESDRILVEVVLPISVVTPALVDRALETIVVGTRLAKKPCTALLDPWVAGKYLEFHNGGQQIHADTHH